MATQAVAEKVIRIDVVTSAAAQANIKALSTQMETVEKQTKKTQESVEKGFGGIERAFGSVARLAAGFGLGLGFADLTRNVITAADSMNVLEARMRLLFKTQKDTSIALNDVVSIAGRTGREIDGVAKLYEKASRAGQQFGVSQRDVAKITEGFSNSLRLSGASTQEAQASLIQFGQALASGRLQGDEFRSLVENNAFFMNEFAKAAGKSLAELRKLGTEGKLSSDFLFDTMLKKGGDGLTLLERINEQAAKVPLTFAQSFTGLASELTGAIGEITKLLNFGTSDPGGFFGALTREIKAFRIELSQARAEADAAGEGFLGRLFGAAGAFARSQRMTSAQPSWLDPGLAAEERARNAQDTAYARATRQVNELRESLQQAVKVRDKLSESLGAADAVSSQDFARLSRLTERVGKLEKDLLNAENFVSSLYTEGRLGRTDGTDLVGNRPKAGAAEEEDKKTLRALEAAGAATRAYLQDLQDRIKVEEALAKGTDLTNEQLRERQKLEELTSKAGGGGANARKKGEASLDQLQKLKEEREMREYLTKLDTAERDSIFSGIDALQKQIQADDAALAALDNKTKKTQEATSAQLEMNLATAEAALFSAQLNGADAARVELLKQYVDIANKAIEKRNELTDAQKKAGEDKAAEELRKKEEKDFKRKVDSVTRGIVDGVGDGKSLFKNIEDTLKNKVFELILKPSIDPLSEELVKLTDELGKTLSDMLSDVFKQIFNASSSGGSSLGGGIGTLLSDGWTWLSSFFANGGVMSPRGAVPLKKYARGGIADSPQVAVYGEGSMNEAYVPLPDGRRIPVKMDQNSKPQNNFQYNIAAGVTRAELMRAMETVRAQTLNDVYKSGRRNGAIGGQ